MITKLPQICSEQSFCARDAGLQNWQLHITGPQSSAASGVAGVELATAGVASEAPARNAGKVGGAAAKAAVARKSSAKPIPNGARDLFIVDAPF
jgi:hypothetical protein